MPRLYRERPLDKGRVIISGDDAHYMSRVLRLRPGDTVRFYWGDGADYVYRVEDLARKHVTVGYIGEEANTGDPRLGITLLQGMPKTGKFDEIVRATTALGVGRIVPFNATRSIGRGEPGKVARWQRVAAEASNQCGRTRVPEIEAPADSLAEALASADCASGIVCWEESGASLHEALVALKDSPKIVIVCGPEGGMTEEEVRAAEAAGLRAASLGPRILRAELAPVAALAIVSFALGEIQ